MPLACYFVTQFANLFREEIKRQNKIPFSLIVAQVRK